MIPYLRFPTLRFTREGASRAIWRGNEVGPVAAPRTASVVVRCMWEMNGVVAVTETISIYMHGLS
jgi:hypothetical protein